MIEQDNYRTQPEKQASGEPPPLLSPEHNELFGRLPYPARQKIREEVGKYIEQMGRDWLPQTPVG